MTLQSFPVSNNHPAELVIAQSRIAQLEAKVEQADYLIAEALEFAVDYEDMLRKMQMAQKTLKEALGPERDLMRVA
jgi:uncharacterized protein involved in exopolysaccharide biosynthesis